MDIALLINAHADNPNVRNLLLRPFADSSLLEIALEKMAHLDAPCRKYVGVSSKESRAAAGRFGGLHMLRYSPEQAAPSTPPEVAFAHLKSLPEAWFLVIDPTYPLVAAEQWWEAVEHFLAVQPSGLVSATLDSSVWFDAGGRPVRDWREAPYELLRMNNAFKIVSREAIFEESRLWAAAEGPPCPFEISKTSSLEIDEMVDLAATEAVYSMSQLGFHA